MTAQRDRVLDQSVQQATDTSASSTSRLAALTQLEGIFSVGASGADSSGIQTAINGFFTGISSLSADPTSTSARQSTLSAVQTLVTAFNGASSQIADQISTLNQQVSGSVSQVNTLLQQIAAANGAISNSSATDDTSSLEDQRTALITQLSGLIGLQQTSAQDGSISLSTTNGTLLVGGNHAFSLSTTNISGTTRVLAGSPVGGGDITATLQGGSIGGTIQARDTDLPAVRSQLDTLAFTFAQTVNHQNEAGLDANGAAGGPVFFVGTYAAGAASNIAVALTGASGIAAASSTESSSGNTNANALLALQTSPTINGQSYSTAFGTLLSGLGNTVASATTDSTANNAITTQLTTQRDSVSGISLDEEAANLTQYQRSYEAASKVLSILNTLFAEAINLGTETAVS